MHNDWRSSNEAFAYDCQLLRDVFRRAVSDFRHSSALENLSRVLLTKYEFLSSLENSKGYLTKRASLRQLHTRLASVNTDNEFETLHRYCYKNLHERMWSLAFITSELQKIYTRRETNRAFESHLALSRQNATSHSMWCVRNPKCLWLRPSRFYKVHVVASTKKSQRLVDLEKYFATKVAIDFVADTISKVTHQVIEHELATRRLLMKVNSGLDDEEAQRDKQTQAEESDRTHKFSSSPAKSNGSMKRMSTKSLLNKSRSPSPSQRSLSSLAKDKEKQKSIASLRPARKNSRESSPSELLVALRLQVLVPCRDVRHIDKLVEKMGVKVQPHQMLLEDEQVEEEEEEDHHQQEQEQKAMNDPPVATQEETSKTVVQQVHHKLEQPQSISGDKLSGKLEPPQASSRPDATLSVLTTKPMQELSKPPSSQPPTRQQQLQASSDRNADTAATQAQVPDMSLAQQPTATQQSSAPDQHQPETIQTTQWEVQESAPCEVVKSHGSPSRSQSKTSKLRVEDLEEQNKLRNLVALAEANGDAELALQLLHSKVLVSGFLRAVEQQGNAAATEDPFSFKATQENAVQVLKIWRQVYRTHTLAAYRDMVCASEITKKATA